MPFLPVFADIRGTIGKILKIGIGGMQLKSEATRLAARNLTDSDYTPMAVGVPTASEDATPYAMVQQRAVLLSGGFNGAAPVFVTFGGTYLMCHTTGGIYTAGMVYLVNPTETGADPIVFYPGLLAATAVGFVGTYSFNTDDMYMLMVATPPYVWDVRGGPIGTADHKVLSEAGDPSAGYLNDKMDATIFQVQVGPSLDLEIGLVTSGQQYSVLMEDPGGTPVFAQLHQEMVLPAFSIAAFAKTAPNAGTLLYRRGDTVTGITSAEVYISGPPVAAVIVDTFGGSVDGGDIDPGAWTTVAPFAVGSLAGSIKRNGSDYGADPTMTATLTAAGMTVQGASFTMQWTRDMWWGVGAAGFSTQVQIEGLAGTELSPTRAPRAILVSPTNEKVYFAYPAALGFSTFTLSGFPAAFNAPSMVVMVVNGVTSTYYLYESTNLLTGVNLNFLVA